MKKVYSLFGLVCLFVGAGSAFAVDSGAMWDPTLTQAKSCTQVENVLKEYLNTNRNGGYF